MLRKSPYNRRYLYASIISVLLLAASVFVLLDTFVIPKAEQPAMTAATLTFTAPSPNPSPIETVYTDTAYTDENIEIHVTTVVEDDLVYYVADVKLSSLAYFKTAFAKDTFGRNVRDNTSDIALNHDAILAINGDYYGYRSTGLVIRNGTLYRDKPTDESLVLMQDGDMRIVDKDVSGESLIQEGALHSWSFGPTLVIDGQFVQRKTSVARNNPRTGIGIVEPYHYIFIVVDGRLADSPGIEIKDFAQLFIDYDCTVAYNLDGGGSATMIMHDNLVNRPCYGEERNISDIIYIGLE